MDSRTISILLVEADDELRASILRILRQEGMRAEAVSTGQEALERIASTPFQLVLANVDLRDITGPQLIVQIRARATGTQIVMLTTNERVPTAVRAVREGALDYIVVPFQDVDQLTTAVNRAIKFIRLEAENRRLIAELTVKNTELTRQNAELYALAQWGRRLSETLDLDQLHKIVVEGLSALMGGRPAALFAAPAKGLRFRRMAMHPPFNVPANPELGLATDALPTTPKRFIAATNSGVVREALVDHLQRQPAATYPLLVAEEPYGFLAVLEDENPGPAVSDSGLDQYVSHVGVCVANAVLFHRLAEGTLRDSLTGLYTASYLAERLIEEVSRAQRTGQSLSLIVMDVDHFDALVKTHGEATGNKVLVAIADILRGTAHSYAVTIRNRLSDVPARLGASRVALILPDTDKRGAMVKAENVRAAVEAAPLPGRETQPGGKITIRSGIASYPEDSGDAATLEREALTALAAASNNQIVAAKNGEVSTAPLDVGD